MLDEPFRTRFGAWVQPIVPGLARLGVTANQVTTLTFVLALIAAALIAAHRPYAGLAVWIVSRFGDGLDGVLARQSKQASPFGGYLDVTLDMAGYAAMVFGFAIAHPSLGLAWLAVLIGYVIVITTTLALSDAGRQSARRISPTDRTFQFTAGLTEAGETSVMYGLWVVFPQQLDWLVWVWVAALAVTALQRTHLAWRLLR